EGGPLGRTGGAPAAPLNSSSSFGTLGGANGSLAGAPPPGSAPQAAGQRNYAQEAPPPGVGPGPEEGAGPAISLDLPQARIVADERNNSLVIFAKPMVYRMIEDTLRKLDVVPLQVLIEA